MATAKEDYKTIVIDNFSGRLTRYINGELNSGFAKFTTTHSMDSFGKPKNISFMETPTQIDSGGSIITDLIVCAKERVENDGVNNISYVYAVGHTARVYKIQVNRPVANNPQYDNPVLLTTLANGQTFTEGGSIEFFGSSGNTYIWIGHDTGVTRLNFDGSSETVVTGSWVVNVPRQVVQFAGSLYHTNGTNISQIDNTLAVVTATKLSPGFPVNTFARDIRSSADGRYVVIVVSEIPLPSIIATNQDTNSMSSARSYIFYWNGSDTAASSFTSIPSFVQTAYYTFENFEYAFGYDSRGANLSTTQAKVLTLSSNTSPLPNAVTSNGNILNWATPVTDGGFLKAAFFSYGALDSEVDIGNYRTYKFSATSPQTDVLQVPCFLPVSNYYIGASTNGYTNNVVGFGRWYFSTLEFNGSATKYRFYSLPSVPTGTGTAALGVYETQTQLFTDKRQIKEIRIYAEPLVTNNSFQIDLIGSDGNVISGGTRIFTVGATSSGTTVGVTSGTDAVKYNPSMAPTYALGVRVTNLGTANWVGHKIEVDHSYGGNI